MNIKNKIKLLLLCFVALAAQAQNNVIDEVIWVVGDDAILKSDVERQIRQAKEERVEIPGDPYCTLAEQLAVRKLFLHQAALDSVEANEGTITQQVEQRISDIIADAGSQERAEARYQRTVRQMRDELKDQAREQMRIQQVQRNLVGDLKITPSDVRKFFDKSGEEKPKVPAKIEIQLITLEPNYGEKEIEEIKEKLRSFKERIESGDASFSVLATIYSDDTESAKNGGEIGFMGKGQLVPEYANEAFTLTDPNKVSRIVQSEFGFHIIQLIERRGDKINTRHILLKPKVQIVEQSKAIARLDSIANLVRSGKMIFEHAVALFSQDKNTRMNDGNMQNPYDGTSQFEYQALPPEIARRVGSMNIGEISAPFTLSNQSGREVCAIFKVKTKIPQHEANIEEDYQLLKNVVQNQRSTEIIDAWIRNKQKETYIQINPDWRNCEFEYPDWIQK